MINAVLSVANPLSRTNFAFDRARLKAGLRSMGPPLLFGLRVWASVSLALYVAYWLEIDEPFWAGTSAAIVCQPRLGASLRKSWFRMIGTFIGGALSVVLTACFPQDRALFLGGLALWGAACAFTATLLRNFAAYAAALAGYTVAIVGGNLLGAAGGVDANAAFLLAVARVSAICIGIVCAGTILALTDFGDARRRLAVLFAGLVAEITTGFAGSLALARAELSDTSVRRELIRRVVALEPLIDETLGESSQIRYHLPVLQSAVNGLFAALAGWRTVVNHLIRLPPDEARREGAVILQHLPPELPSPETHVETTRWIADPAGLHRTYEVAERRLSTLLVGTSSLRLLADQTAKALAGIAHTLNGLALLIAEPVRSQPRRDPVRLYVPDLLPALVNAGRTFVTIGAVELFWVVTGWPDGTGAIIFASIAVILLALRADQAYAAAQLFMVGILLNVVIAATVTFAVLPALGTETFAALSLAIGLCLVPIGALLAQARQPWQVGLFTAMMMNFVPLVHPTNPMSYDPAQFYNQALAIVAGNCAAALSFRLMPPLSPAFRTRRLLALTLHDLRKLAAGRPRSDWEGHVHRRLAVMPDAATPLQRAQLLAALSAGSEVIRLRQIAHDLGLGAELGLALAAFVRSEITNAVVCFARLDAAFAARADTGSSVQTALRARGSILVLSELLTQHATYFDTGAPR